MTDEEIFYNFIGSWFPDADFEGMSDEEETLQFKKVSSPKEIKAVVSYIDKILKSNAVPLEKIEHWANRHFEGSSENCKAWLRGIANLLNES
jgi:hypothetical protein